MIPLQLGFPSLSGGELGAVIFAGAVVLLALGFLLFKRVLTKGLNIVDAWQGLVTEVAAIAARLTKLDAKLDDLAKHERTLERHDLRIEDFRAQRDKDHVRLGNVEKHTDFVLQKLEDIEASNQEQTGVMKGISARLARLEDRLEWDGRERRRST